jgi:hypothetical protein
MIHTHQRLFSILASRLLSKFASRAPRGSGTRPTGTTSLCVNSRKKAHVKKRKRRFRQKEEEKT